MIPALDGFRGLAALSVVAYHCYLGAGLPALDEGPLRAVLAASYMGVDFFFVISGFVLFLPTALAGGVFGDVRTYARRRLARIVPAYYLFLLAAIVLNRWVAVGVELPQESAKGLASLFVHLGFLQHQFGQWLGGAGFGVLTVAWTLTLELAFYALLPVVAERFHRHPVRWLVGAIVVSTAWRVAATHSEVSLGWLGSGGWNDTDRFVRELILVTQLPNFLAHFAAGMTAAWLYARLRRSGLATGGALDARWARLLPIAQLGCVLAILAFMRSEGIRQIAGTGGLYDDWTRTTPVAFAFAALILFTAAAPRWSQWPMANPAARWLGDVSYGTYLAHLGLVGFALVTLKWVPDASTWALLRMAALVVPGSLLIGWLSMTLVERPARRWARRRPPAAAVGSGVTGMERRLATPVA